MGKRLAAIIGVAIIGFLAGRAQAGDTLEQVKKKGVLVVGVPYQVPPFGFFDPESGGLAGYDVDVAIALADKLGVRLELKPVDRETNLPALIGGQVDFVAANVTADPDTGKVIAFSDVYLTTGVGFIAKTGTVKGPSDLKGRKIAVGKGTVAEDTVKDAVPGTTSVVFDDLYPALKALESGSVAAAAGDTSILPVLLPMLPEGAFEVLPFQVAEIPYVLGMRRDDKPLQDFVNQTIREMQQSGELKKLHAHWFEAAPDSGEEEPAAAAAAVVSRKATTRPRYVAVILRGVFVKGAEVSVFSTDGEFVCTGNVGAVFDDEVYVDVDPAKYDLVKTGFAVGMDVDRERARGAILEHQDILKSVQEQAQEDAAAVAAEIDAEGKAKQQRQAEADAAKYKSDLVLKSQRAAARDNRYYYRGRYYRGKYYRGSYYRGRRY